MYELNVAASTPLVVVDVQKGFEDDEYWGVRNNPHAEANVRRLVDAWRASGRAVVFVRHDSTEPRSPLRPGQSGNDFSDQIADVAPDLLIAKSTNSGFLGTPSLEDWLRSSGADQFALCGISTNTCVETTARMGGNLGFDVLFALDATYAFALTGSDGTTLSADELYRATSVNLSASGFARVVSTDQLSAVASAAV